MNHIQRCKPLLGTYVDISVTGALSDDEIIHWTDIAFNEIERIHHLMGFHHEESELTYVNRALITGNKQAIDISVDLQQVLSFALTLNHLTDGYYDVCIAPLLIQAQRLPNHLNIPFIEFGNSRDISLCDGRLYTLKPVCIDLGGIAKGYAVDCAVKKIPEMLDITINAGGDMYQRNWQNTCVWLKYAKRSTALKQTKMRNCALASSGNYHAKKLSSIYHPKTSIQCKISGGVSVFAPSTMVADALTKVVTLVPKKKVKTILAQFQAQAIKINRFGLLSVIK